MEERTPAPSEPSPADPTLDVAPRRPSASDPGSSAADEGKVRLVKGSAPELTHETQVLLRRRLRLAAVLLFVAFAVFLASHVLRSRPPGSLLLGLHVLTTVVLGLLAAVLCRGCPIPLRWLRLAELVVFGLPAAFFLAVQHSLMLYWSKEGFCRFPAGLWLVLIYTYALFIPNTLRRAAVVIAILTLAPLLLFLLMFWAYPEVYQVAATEDLTEVPLILVLAAAGSVFGVDTIGTLRREAFEAKRLGQYRLTERIGSGGMGEVYLAEHQLLKRPCAIKLIRPGSAADPRVLARFRREVQSTARLTHWNTVEIFDFGSTDDGTFYYVMEYLPGMSLGELVERFGPLPPERVIHLLQQACDALSEAHAVGLIHRDIKPGNLFAAQRGGVYDVVKVLDFGLVKPLVDEQPIRLTIEGSITGSPLFMSPEQVTADSPADARSDVYSLGAVGYYLLAGRPPFAADKPIKAMIAHAHEQAPPPSAYRPDIPSDLEKVILRCLAKDPAGRYPDAASLAAALGACEAAGKWTRARAARWWHEQQQQQTVTV